MKDYMNGPLMDYTLGDYIEDHETTLAIAKALLDILSKLNRDCKEFDRGMVALDRFRADNERRIKKLERWAK